MIKTTTLSAEYFHRISQALEDAGSFRPTLVIDKARFDENLKHLMDVIQQGFDYRIVAKSLPSIPLLEYIMERSGSNRLMSFHLPFLFHVVKHLPHADVLLGKPMPVAAARQFYSWHATLSSASLTSSSFKPAEQLHWLVDSLDRLLQYQELAKSLGCVINVNLEIDVGLHRGGFINNDEFHQSILLLNKNPHLKLTGLMGYEAHVSKMPKLIGGSKKAFSAAMSIYQQCVDTIKEVMGSETAAKLIFNAGGSSTYPLYAKTKGDNKSQSDFITEIATASALVKPTDFDVATLEHHKPACFIATPVLKLVKNPEIPMLSGLSSVLRTMGLLPKQACFIYGGNWLASPCFPADSQRSTIFGSSSNQEMYELKDNHTIKVDDYFYFRPSQSEAVLLQFGKIAVYDNGKIIDWWSIFHPETTTVDEEDNYINTNKNKNTKEIE